MNGLEQQIETLLFEQKRDWRLAHDHYAALAHVQSRCFREEDRTTILQFNPERIRSSAAKIDPASLQARPCFFCHRPEEQRSVIYNDSFELMVNPYPIFESHLTIPLRWHERQQIRPYFRDMLDLAAELPSFALFYNGPKCGASAPDHMHFQAGIRSGFPVVQDWAKMPTEVLWRSLRTSLYVSSAGHSPVTFVLVSEDREEVAALFGLLYDRMELRPGEYEPMMNVLMWKQGDLWIVCLFPRRELRPSCYYAEGEANILISPATVEMSGLFVVPLEKDFEKVTYADLRKIWQEVSLTEEEKQLLIQHIQKEL